MQLKDVQIPSAAGRKLILTFSGSDSTTKGVVLINTGTCIPQRIYRSFADYLAGNGYTTITYDYSDASNFQSDITHLEWIEDMNAVLDYVLASYPAQKNIWSDTVRVVSLQDF